MYPCLVDSTGTVVSFPPVTNSGVTRLALASYTFFGSRELFFLRNSFLFFPVLDVIQIFFCMKFFFSFENVWI